MSKVPFVALVLVLVALLQFGLRLGSAPQEPGEAPRGADLAPDGARPAGASGARSHDPVAVRRSLVAEAAPPSEKATARPADRASARIPVCGQVRGGRGAVADYDLSFHVAGAPAKRAADWDFTDEAGRFEVELPAGTYSVYGVGELPIATFDVTAGSEKLLLDLVVPD